MNKTCQDDVNLFDITSLYQSNIYTQHNLRKSAFYPLLLPLFMYFSPENLFFRPWSPVVIPLESNLKLEDKLEVDLDDLEDVDDGERHVDVGL